MMNPTIRVEGKLYYQATKNRCPVCAYERYMYVKQPHAGPAVTLECAVCEYTLTVRKDSVIEEEGGGV